MGFWRISYSVIKSTDTASAIPFYFCLAFNIDMMPEAFQATMRVGPR